MKDAQFELVKWFDHRAAELRRTATVAAKGRMFGLQEAVVAMTDADPLTQDQHAERQEWSKTLREQFIPTGYSGALDKRFD